jgi:hypothetical protein
MYNALGLLQSNSLIEIFLSIIFFAIAGVKCLYLGWNFFRLWIFKFFEFVVKSCVIENLS